MACFRPVFAWRTDGGEIVFGAERKGVRSVALPCGYCMGCRLMRARSWAIRCMHEAQMHRVNSFITLTYDDKHYRPSLNYLDFQRFMYRLRVCDSKYISEGRVRFFVAGEYGESSGRPHFHALLFGKAFRDLTLIGKPNGHDLYRSDILDKLWSNGFASIGNVTPESALYCAKYSCKKVYGVAAKSYYSRVDLHTGEVVDVVPEFAHMSLKPGIGYSWFNKYWKEVYLARDGVVAVGGRVSAPPRYYDKLLEDLDSDLREYKDFERYVRSRSFVDDCTPARLLDRERCAVANFSRRRSRL